MECSHIQCGLTVGAAADRGIVYEREDEYSRDKAYRDDRGDDLLGDQEVILEYGEFYEELGAKMVLSGKILPKQERELHRGKLKIAGSVDPSVLGRYTVTYSAEYFVWKAEASRTVCVVDTVPPVIMLQPDPEEALLPGVIYQESGFEAMDNYDGDITARVNRSVVGDEVIYTVIDSSGNRTEVSRICRKENEEV